MKRIVTIWMLAVMALPVFAQEFPRAADLRPFRPDTSRFAGAVPSIIPDQLRALDPMLHLVRGFRAQLAKQGADVSRQADGFSSLLSSHIRDGRTMLSLFLKSNDVSATATRIRALGGDVESIAGDVLTCAAPLDALDAIAADPSVRVMQHGSYLSALMNVSRKEIRADAVHTGVNLSRAYTGKGVVLGVVDSGIDWAHPDFRSSSGSRIQYIWDMSDSTSTAAAPPPEYGYGRQYAKAAIDAGACLERDLQDGHGHGTHVTGTAAGNGSMNREYTGIAPEADIVFVKGFRSGPGFKDTDVINGCDFIFKRAGAMQKPAVINLSLGGQLGAHDGSSLYEQALSNLVGPGRIIVASAGNSGGQRMHVRYTTGGDATEPRVTFFRVPQGAPSAVIDIWYSGGPVNVGLAWYNDYPWNLGNSPLVVGGAMLDGINVFGNVAGIVNVGSDPSNGLGHATLALMQTGFGTSLSNLLFAVYTTGSGTLDGWLLNGEFGPTQNAENHIFPGDLESSVGMPATAKRLISVGSYVTKNQWVDEAGFTQTQDGNPTPGALSSFSSTGPSRDGRQKPDISAPGEAILSALSSDCGADASSILFGGGYQKMQGTSMASPHVAGVVALMLERNSSLDYPDVLGALTNTARRDAFSGATANTRFGHGKVDALAAVQAVTPRKLTGGVAPTSVTLSAHPNPASAWTTINYALPSAGIISVKLFDALGREMRSVENGFREAGNYSVRFDGNGLPGGVYFCSLLSAGGNATMRVVLR